MLSRGWNETEMAGLLGGNLLRVMDEVEQVKIKFASQPPSREIYDKRNDLQPLNWGGPDGAYLPADVNEMLTRRGRLDDEL